MGDDQGPAIFQAIREIAEGALHKLETGSDAERNALGAINWADLGVVEVLRCEHEDQSVVWRVLIEEADPSCGLPSPVYAALRAALPNLEFDVAAEW